MPSKLDKAKKDFETVSRGSVGRESAYTQQELDKKERSDELRVARAKENAKKKKFKDEDETDGDSRIIGYGMRS